MCNSVDSWSGDRIMRDKVKQVCGEVMQDIKVKDSGYSWRRWSKYFET